MRKTFFTSLGLVLLALCLPLLFLGAGTDVSAPETEAPPDTQPPDAPTASPEASALPQAAAGSDAAIIFTASMDGETVTVDMASYLPGVVAAEMPASFEAEALKAQAVAARTYILYCMGLEKEAHPDADVCGDSGCCKAYLSEVALRERWGDNFDTYWAAIRASVTETDGLYLTYEGSAIQAVHSSSAGQTEDSGSLWGALPYLTSVESPETEADVPGYISTVEVSPEDFRETIQGYSPEAALGEDPAAWVGAATETAGGRVDTLLVGGVEISGQALRSLFGLRSTAFTLAYTGESFLFTVTGYGHGVGMSQYGANVLAQGGSSFDAILAHYYPGTVLCAWR